MVQALDKYSKEEKFEFFLNGSDFAMYEANRDKHNYAKYKSGNYQEFSNEVKRDMHILEILDKLGYPLDELGTFFYKDVIAQAYEEIKDVSKRDDMEKCRALMQELTNAFSNLYHYIAREIKEIGVKPFHLYIEQAIKNIDECNIDIELSKKIFGDKAEKKDYGLQAFQIAAYAAKKYSYDNVKEYHKPVVKKLTNFPDNIELKRKF